VGGRVPDRIDSFWGPACPAPRAPLSPSAACNLLRPRSGQLPTACGHSRPASRVASLFASAAPASSWQACVPRGLALAYCCFASSSQRLETRSGEPRAWPPPLGTGANRAPGRSQPRACSTRKKNSDPRPQGRGEEGRGGAKRTGYTASQAAAPSRPFEQPAGPLPPLLPTWACGEAFCRDDLVPSLQPDVTLLDGRKVGKGASALAQLATWLEAFGGFGRAASVGARVTGPSLASKSACGTRQRGGSRLHRQAKAQADRISRHMVWWARKSHCGGGSVAPRRAAAGLGLGTLALAAVREDLRMVARLSPQRATRSTRVRTSTSFMSARLTLSARAKRTYAKPFPTAYFYAGKRWDNGGALAAPVFPWQQPTLSRTTRTPSTSPQPSNACHTSSSVASAEWDVGGSTGNGALPSRLLPWLPYIRCADRPTVGKVAHKDGSARVEGVGGRHRHAQVAFPKHTPVPAPVPTTGVSTRRFLAGCGTRSAQGQGLLATNGVGEDNIGVEGAF
jgi:hypothetical protein